MSARKRKMVSSVGRIVSSEHPNETFEQKTPIISARWFRRWDDDPFSGPCCGHDSRRGATSIRRALPSALPSIFLFRQALETLNPDTAAADLTTHLQLFCAVTRYSIPPEQ